MSSIYSAVSRVRHRVAAGFEYADDIDQWGVIEDWRIPDNVDSVRGDCDDFALACRHLLRQEGIPTRLVVCQTKSGDFHLVCTVGDYVLDNRFDRVMRKSTLETRGYGYRWIAISGENPGDDWHELLAA